MFPTPYQGLIHTSRYARFIPEHNRREHAQETFQRYFDFFDQHLIDYNDEDRRLDPAEVTGLRAQMEDLRVMPSMRALMTAGPALARDHIAGYNCAYRQVSDVRAFDEILFVLLCGTGVGFSVERQFIKSLPTIPADLKPCNTVIHVADSKRGWAEAFRQLVALLYSGNIPKWDVSEVRPAGSILKTFGGRASGPQPLIDLFKFVIEVFQKAAGDKLTSEQCHDIVCKEGEIVVVGGVRRAALISLSNLSDQRMRDAKVGKWWIPEPQRALANNSVAYTERPEVGQFLEEMTSLYKSKSGERGIFNREAAVAIVKRNGRRAHLDADTGNEISFGTNPCSEIILRSEEFCNLSEVVARVDDDMVSLEDKVKAATIVGTMQATLTDFRYIGDQWKINCEEERLLGVSITGIMDSPLLNIAAYKADPDALIKRLEYLKGVSIATNKVYAQHFGINQAAAITCVKPSGTVSQLVDASSGIHPRHSEFYIRRLRMDTKDPLTEVMVETGYPHEPDRDNPSHVLVFDFPMRAPEGATLRKDVTAIDQLEHWKIFQNAWCEHKPSITVNVRENEWPSVIGWVYDNFDLMSGVSFLPYSDHNYPQAPYEEVDEDTLEHLEARMPKDVDIVGLLAAKESEDNTTGSQELACSAGVCDI